MVHVPPWGYLHYYTMFEPFTNGYSKPVQRFIRGMVLIIIMNSPD